MTGAIDAVGETGISMLTSIATGSVWMYIGLWLAGYLLYRVIGFFRH
jgi:hypothetical protein